MELDDTQNPTPDEKDAETPLAQSSREATNDTSTATSSEDQQQQQQAPSQDGASSTTEGAESGPSPATDATVGLIRRVEGYDSRLRLRP